MHEKDDEPIPELTEGEWESASDWGRMLNHVWNQASTRKKLLLAVALCRRIWNLLPYDDCRQAVTVVEQLADHPRVDEADYTIVTEVRSAMTRLQEGYIRIHEAAAGPRGAYLAALSCTGIWDDADGLIENTADAAAIAAAVEAEGPVWEAERRAQAELVQELFGNPFRPIAIDRSWLTSDVAGLARRIYNERDFDRLPTVADALQHAGCDQVNILTHCKQPGLHVRGCWVIDLLLGLR